MLPFTLDELNTAIAKGEVTERPHPTLDLYIYNYSPEVQYTKNWNRVTRACRGLILDGDGNVVARPWEKFFNLGEVELPMQFDDPVEVMDKADGSLGILYPLKPPTYSGHHDYAISTRGSFTSEQAIRATQIWNEKYPHIQPCDDLTMLFEIVYPQNRIVLDYGDMEDLILLGAVSNRSGYYHGPNDARWSFYGYKNGICGPREWPGPVIDVMPYKSISEALSHTDRKNAEGFVIRSHNFMVKLKQADYLELHRLVTNASPKTVWEQLKAGKSKSDIISQFPDEFHAYIEKMIDPLLEAFEARYQEILQGYSERIASITDKLRDLSTFPDRKDFATAFKNSPDKRYFFLLLDGRGIREVLWAELKPREAVPAN